MPSRVKDLMPCGNKSSSNSIRELRLTSSLLKPTSWLLRTRAKSPSSTPAKCIEIQLLAPASMAEMTRPGRVATATPSPQPSPPVSGERVAEGRVRGLDTSQQIPATELQEVRGVDNFCPRPRFGGEGGRRPGEGVQI